MRCARKAPPSAIPRLFPPSPRPASPDFLPLKPRQTVRAPLRHPSSRKIAAKIGYQPPPATLKPPQSLYKARYKPPTSHVKRYHSAMIPFDMASGWLVPGFDYRLGGGLAGASRNLKTTGWRRGGRSPPPIQDPVAEHPVQCASTRKNRTPPSGLAMLCVTTPSAPASAGPRSVQAASLPKASVCWSW